MTLSEYFEISFTNCMCDYFVSDEWGSMIAFMACEEDTKKLKKSMPALFNCEIVGITVNQNDRGGMQINFAVNTNRKEKQI